MNYTSSTTPMPGNSTEHSPEAVKGFSKAIGILMVPLIVITIVFVLSGILYYLMKKRKLDQLRHHLVPMYNFDPNEGDEWEADVPEITVRDPRQNKRQPDYRTIGMGSERPDVMTSSPRA